MLWGSVLGWRTVTRPLWVRSAVQQPPHDAGAERGAHDEADEEARPRRGPIRLRPRRGLGRGDGDDLHRRLALLVLEDGADLGAREHGGVPGGAGGSSGDLIARHRAAVGLV